MAAIRLIGVPFDGMGRKPGQAGAPAALRAAGLEAAVSSHEVVSRPDLTLPEAPAERPPESGSQALSVRDEQCKRLRQIEPGAGQTLVSFSL